MLIKDVRHLEFGKSRLNSSFAARLISEHIVSGTVGTDTLPTTKNTYR